MEYVVELGRRERKRQALHQQLLVSAHALFRERGIAGTTVDDIADAADVARQTVFNHFPYKEALALELSAVELDKIAQQANAVLEAGISAVDVLKRTSEWVLDTGIEQGEVAVAVARELMHPDADRAQRAAEHVPLRHVFEALLHEAAEEHAVRRDLPIATIAARVSEVVTGILAQVTRTEAQKLREELAVWLDILFNGITERRT